MTLTTAAIGLLALAAQIGVPLPGAPGGAPLPAAAAAGAEAPVPAAPALGAAGSAAGAPLPLADGALEAAYGLYAASLAWRTREALSGTPFASRLGAADYVWIEATLSRLTLREKVAQLVVPYLEGGHPGRGTPRWNRGMRLVEEHGVGGFIVGVGSGYGTAGWLNELQSRSRVPLLVTADLEWGPGTRLRGATVLPINMALAAAGPAALAYAAGRITGLEARAAGIHMAFAPVADVNVNPENPVINTRAYGSDASLVSERVVQFIRGARSAGLMTVVKHFPGHGDTEVDSHLAMPVLAADRLRLETVELAPFRAAIGAEVEGVMTAHLAVPALDPGARLRPATVSPPILTGLLRHELGFGGLVITDALHMDGVKKHGRAGKVAVDAIAAGADILLIPPDELEAIDAVVRAVLAGPLSEARIDASVRRVLAAKAAAGLVAVRTSNMGELLTQVGRVDHGSWGREAAERSITLVRGRPGALPLRVRDRTVLAVLYDDRRNHDAGRDFEAALAERGARVVTVRLSRSAGPEALARARRLAGVADEVVFASFSRALPWKGTLGLPADVAALADELAARGAIVVSFGDPYLLRQLPAAPVYLLAWSHADASQRAAARALVGEVPVTGRLPIDLPPDYPVGHGLVLPSLPGITTLPR